MVGVVVAVQVALQNLLQINHKPTMVECLGVVAVVVVVAVQTKSLVASVASFPFRHPS